MRLQRRHTPYRLSLFCAQASLLAPVFKLLSPQAPRRGSPVPTATIEASLAPLDSTCSAQQLACLTAALRAALQHTTHLGGAPLPPLPVPGQLQLQLQMSSPGHTYRWCC